MATKAAAQKADLQSALWQLCGAQFGRAARSQSGSAVAGLKQGRRPTFELQSALWQLCGAYFGRAAGSQTSSAVAGVNQGRWPKPYLQSALWQQWVHTLVGRRGPRLGPQ